MDADLPSFRNLASLSFKHNEIYRIAVAKHPKNDGITPFKSHCWVIILYR